MNRTGLLLLVCSSLWAQTGTVLLGVAVLLAEQLDLLKGKASDDHHQTG